MKEIIERLESKRKELGLSYEDVAELDDKNLSKSNVWKILTGATKPYFETLMALGKVLGFEFSMKEIKKLKKIETVSEEIKPKIDIIQNPKSGSTTVNEMIDELKKINYPHKDIFKEVKAKNEIENVVIQQKCGCYVENSLLKRQKNSKCKLTKEQHNF